MPIGMTTEELIRTDKRHLWHPFTPMQDWCAEGHDPLIIAKGQGAWLWDSQGKKYLDGNSSIWTNIHGHNHPTITQRLTEQLQTLSHSSFLGSTNEPAIQLAAELVARLPGSSLERVFYSDNGSTAVECALKMAVQYWQLKGHPERCHFLAFDQAYHGDTMGANSLGAIPAFHGRFHHLGLTVHHITGAESLSHIPDSITEKLAAVIIEPLIQGAAGMRTWPAGMLAALRSWCDWHGILLIYDEVMTGFGRTGQLFACQTPGEAYPDVLCLAKGLTGGYLPLAATLCTEQIFQAFLGKAEEMKTFYYGHSYCGNPLGCAAALGSLAVFDAENTLHNLAEKIAYLANALAKLKEAHPQHVGTIRQSGFIAGIDVLLDAPNDEPYPWQQSTGARICQAARAHGLLTRPVRDTLVLMPPLCVTHQEIDHAVKALELAIHEVCTLMP